MRIAKIFPAIVFVAALGLSACAPQPLSLSEMYGFCIMEPLSEENQCEMQTVCGAFSEALNQEFSNLQACLDACEQTAQQQNMIQVMRGCDSTIIRGSNLCTQYCRRAAAK